MNIKDFYKVGLVMKPHGLKGQVTVLLEAEVLNDFPTHNTVFIELNNQLVPHFIQSVSMKGQKAFVKFEDVDTVESAGFISRHTLYLPSKSRPKPKRGEFYDDEIIGFKVEEENAGMLGTVSSVINSGPNRLLSVDRDGKELLIPVNGPFIKDVNRKSRQIMVALPEGFLSL